MQSSEVNSITYAERARELFQVAAKTRSVIEKYAATDNSDDTKRAQALLIITQLDLASAYLILLTNPYGDAFTGRAVIIRSLMEHQANSLHIGTSTTRAKKYLGYTEAMGETLENNMREIREGAPHKSFKTKKWTESDVRQRMKLIADIAPLAYDSFSDFVHGNNTPDFFNDARLLKSFEETMDNTYITLLMNILLRIGSSFTQDILDINLHEEMLEVVDKGRELELVR